MSENVKSRGGPLIDIIVAIPFNLKTPKAGGVHDAGVKKTKKGAGIL